VKQAEKHGTPVERVGEQIPRQMDENTDTSDDIRLMYYCILASSFAVIAIIARISAPKKPFPCLQPAYFRAEVNR